MEHSFSKEMAEYTTVNAALIHRKFTHWFDYVKNHAKNEKDGMFWFYTSVASLKDTFPYLGDKAIRNAIDLLVEKGFVLIGEYNEKLYNKSKWYTLTDLYDNLFSEVAPAKEVKKIANEDKQKANAFIDRWNELTFRKVRSRTDALVGKIITRLSTRKEEDIEEFFNKLKMQTYLANENWFSLEYCVRNEETWDKIIRFAFDFKKPKLDQGSNNGDEQHYI